MDLLHILHEKNRKTYLILICPFIKETTKIKYIQKLNYYLMRDIIINTKNKYIFNLCYKYNKEVLMECFKYDSISLLISLPLELITTELLNEINLDYYIFIDYLYKGPSYYTSFSFGIDYSLIEKIIDQKKDSLINIIKSNKLTPNFEQMTEQDKELINKIVPLKEINFKKLHNQETNITDNDINKTKDIILSKPKKLTLKQNKHY